MCCHKRPISYERTSLICATINLTLALSAQSTGINAAPYDEAFRRKHKLYLSILKEFGFGQRLMETRINVEVAEFIKQARLTDGKPFNPKELIHLCIMNINNSILIGR